MWSILWIIFGGYDGKGYKVSGREEICKPLHPDPTLTCIRCILVSQTCFAKVEVFVVSGAVFDKQTRDGLDSQSERPTRATYTVQITV